MSQNPGVQFDEIQVSNYMNQARRDQRCAANLEGGQVNALLNRLTELEKNEGGWFYSFWHNDNDRLARFFWMSPYQVSLTRLHGDVIVVDVSEGRNVYNMYLTTFIIIDGENRSRDIAFCLSERQDQQTFKWMFQLLKSIFDRSPVLMQPEAIFSDRDLAIAGALSDIWPEVFHGSCIWHIHENLIKNLRSKLGPLWTQFMMEFWEVYRMGSPATFGIAWNRLLTNYEGAAHYLMTSLYPDHKKWAWAYVGPRFTAGLKTTGRVENEHKNYKLIGLGPHSTLIDVFEKLSGRSAEQRDQSFNRNLKVLVRSAISANYI